MSGGEGDNNEEKTPNAFDEFVSSFSWQPFDFSFSNPDLKSAMIRSGLWSVASGIGGVTTAYIEGKTLFFPMYFFTGVGFCYGSAFFGSSLAFKHFRQNRDDAYNNICGGAVSFTVIGTALRGVKKGLKSGLLGAGLGAAYYYGSNWLYQNTRDNWLEFRRYQLHTQEPKVFGRPAYDKKVTIYIGNRDAKLPPKPLVPFSEEAKEFSKKQRPELFNNENTKAETETKAEGAASGEKKEGSS